MRIAEVDKRWGRTAQKWVWVSGPQYTFDDDGAERPDLEPVDGIPAEAYSDEWGWWTCDQNTRVHDLAVIYRSGAKNDSGYLPKQGPRDLKYVAIATSDAFRDASDPFSNEFSGYYKCRFVIVAKLDPPIGIAQLRANPVTNDWSALRASFVKAAMPMPQPVWEHLITLDQRTAKAKDRRPAKPARKPPTPQERVQIERKLEAWLASDVAALGQVLGFPVELIDRQSPCGSDHGGLIDLLLRRTDRKNSYVVVELKADEVRRDAIAQALGYVGWMHGRRQVKECESVVIGIGEHRQVPFVLKAIPPIVAVFDWDDIDLPDELQAEIAWAGEGL